MEKQFHNKKIKIDRRGLPDAIFLIAIFIFFSVLIIGLFPRKGIGIAIGKDFLIYLIMMIPILASIYYIAVSFQRKFYPLSKQTSSSIKNKMALAFIFVALIPTLVIVLASNNFINKAFLQMFSAKTSGALKKAVDQSNQNYNKFYNNFQKEIKSFNHLINLKVFSPENRADRINIAVNFGYKSISIMFFKLNKTEDTVELKIEKNFKNKIHEELYKFYKSGDLFSKRDVDRLYINHADYLTGKTIFKNYFIILFVRIPESFNKNRQFFVNSFDDYKKHEYYKTLFRSSSGIFLLILTVIIVLVAVFVSLFLSKSITRPVLELVNSVKKVSMGDFNLNLKRDSNDELGLLFASVNKMALQLDNNRKIMYQKQKLEAWREMAKRLVHEIKNPLTPIRLSAERMRKRFIEEHPEIEKILLTGTSTIIEEVNILMTILSEFTKFARLPEMKPQETDINRLIRRCVNLFSGHEKIKFKVDLVENIPPVNLDKILIRQVVTNFIQNSIEAMDNSGNIFISSELFTEDNCNMIRVRFKDDGMGMDEEKIEKIFEPGFSTKSKGTGLGLSIVKMIILEHDGKVFCTSESGKGTEFIVELPINNQEEQLNGEIINS